MKVTINRIKAEPLDGFADKYGLKLEVNERDQKTIDSCHWITENDRFYAHFTNCETKEGGVLKGSYGNGRTPDDAITAYCKEIQGCLLVLDSHGDSRQEIQAPALLTHTPKRAKPVQSRKKAP